MMYPLTHMANRFGTDKGTATGNAHAYTVVYDQLFAPLREHPIKLLEIGLSIGGPEQNHPASRTVTAVPSIRLWQSYFSAAHIFGLDISDCSAFRNDRFTFFQADCGDRSALRAVASQGIEFDIIIDDGSHASYHQQLTLAELFPTLKRGGLYIIEDLDWQPKAYEASLPAVRKTADLFVDLRNAASGATTTTDLLRGIPEQLATIDIYTEQDLQTGVPRALRHKRPNALKQLERSLRQLWRGEGVGSPVALVVLRKA